MSAAVAAHGQMRARLTDAMPLALLLISTTQCSFISLYLHRSMYMYIHGGVHGMDSARLSLVTSLHPLTHAPTHCAYRRVLPTARATAAEQPPKETVRV